MTPARRLVENGLKIYNGSYDELAKASGVTVKYLKQITNGKQPGVRNVEKLLKWGILFRRP